MNAIAKRQELRELCRRHGLALVYLFGSQAANGARLLDGETAAPSDALADLDVGVVTLEPLLPPHERYQFYARLFNDLEDVFKPFPLDLVLLEENHSVFQLEAIKGICVYQVSEEKRDEYEMNILRRAADFAPVLDLFHREYLEEFRVAEG
ncbi:MAG: nucleotidyltransferase domain-containing protein [Bacillota bacterium]|nr:nucleotidyltransferase domain-containing protein [Bacillota bacterium]